MRSLGMVIPVFNEEENLKRLAERLTKVALDLSGISWSVLFVDDHSTDRTPEILEEIHQSDSRFGWLRLSRNRGSHIACAAGLDSMETDLVIVMAADLQDPPEVIPLMIQKYLGGAQLVWAVREERAAESFLTKMFSQLYYYLMNRFTDLRFPPRGADMFLADRKVIEAFRQVQDRSLSLFAVLMWLGFRQDSVSYVKQARFAGTSKWTLRKKILLAVDSFVGFSYLPLRLMSYTGFVVAALGVLGAMLVLVMKFLGMTQAVGYASLMIVILVLGGFQMLMFGVLGEYLWRTLEEARKRPRYFVEGSSNHKRGG